MRKTIIVILIGAVLIFAAFAFGMCASVFKKSPLIGGGIGLIKIEGTIFTADDILEQLKEARLDSRVKAILIRIDSPGGAVSASQEIYEEVKRLDKEKPVIVSMGNVAASGGYYIACGARKIFANPGTITGSIGVRMEHVNLKDLLTWAKVEHQTLKSGEFKDVGSPDRPLTKEERELLENVLKNMHAQFKKTVASQRKIPAETVEKIADGRIYTGEQALELKLIDEIGGFPMAVKDAARLAGIKGEPALKKFKEERSWWVRLFFEQVLSVLNSASKTLAVYKL